MKYRIITKKYCKRSARLLSIVVAVVVCLWLLLASSYINNYGSYTEFNNKSGQVEIKTDSLAILNNTKYSKVVDENILPSNSLLQEISGTLQSHPLRLNQQKSFENVIQALLFLSKAKQCIGKPVIVSMAHVGSLLYWQL